MSPPSPFGVRRVWPRVRLVVSVLVPAGVLWRFGTGPVVGAVRVTSWPAVSAALLINAGSTVASAWRWRVVAGALGAPLGLGASLSAYYRSQFLNVVLPGGVLGDAHRGIRHGRLSGDLGVGLRATVWDRVTGQVVQAGLLVLAMTLLGTELVRWTPYALLAAVIGLGAVVLVRRLLPLGPVDREMRCLLRPGVALPLATASVASSLGHVTVFLVAAHAAGVTAPPRVVVTVALLVLVASAVPLNVAGWGPREGATAAVFAAVGLGSSTGLTVSIEYGVLGALATAPGAVVLLAEVLDRRNRPPQPASASVDEEAPRA